MRQFKYLLILLIFTNCSSDKKSNNAAESGTVESQKITTLSSKAKDDQPNKIQKQNLDKRANIDTLMNGKFDLNSDIFSLIPFENGKLEVFSHKLANVYIVDYNLFRKHIEEYNFQDSIEKVDVFIYKDSYLKETPKYRIYGKILSEDIELSENVKIGMSKTNLLSKIFKPSDSFDKVKVLVVYENEIGDYWLNFKFDTNKLIEVEYDTNNDWVDRALKK
ncbi:hypothetical protein EO244_06925 [Ancylomarina salipaludis]|uniref:Uncharacterized protein n=1 Tax=Ancylomarina salipaludis TaxID=2501299 RepID=A0A4Q1JM69_9BACT|nr:hypothetical protein [Ancylomarina salipaludis]RXQ95591.1 hypothetical protein EO244_06925 [Ancylomarina salipaludis]